MAKRELSSTLRNLKFMQRAAQKEEKPKKEEEDESKPNGTFVSPAHLSKKCVVIMEGDPHPGAVKGRMSFLNFNPTIDKLNDEAANHGHPEASASSSGQPSGSTPDRESRLSQNGSETTEVGMPDSDGDGELKRKQAPVASEMHHQNKLHKNVEGDPQSSSHESRSSSKKQKREKLDWNILRPPKSQSKKR
ncbi:hypothetical protein Ancab_007314 [Ancistrocladus abbreviatus]